MDVRSHFPWVRRNGLPTRVAAPVSLTKTRWVHGGRIVSRVGQRLREFQLFHISSHPRSVGQSLSFWLFCNGNPSMKKGVKLEVKGQEKGSVWKGSEWGQGWHNLRFW